MKKRTSRRRSRTVSTTVKRSQARTAPEWGTEEFPTHCTPSRSGWNPAVMKNAAHRGGGHVAAQLAHLALDPQVATRGIVRGQPDDEIARVRHRWPAEAATAPERGPLSAHQLPVPADHGVRPDQQRPPGRTWQPLSQCGEDEPVTRLQAQPAGGRPAVWWQTQKTVPSANPGARVPRGRTAGPLSVLVDTREKCGWKFANRLLTTQRRALAAGDYGALVEDRVVAVVKRKSLAIPRDAAFGRKPELPDAAPGRIRAGPVVVKGDYPDLFRTQPGRGSWLAYRFLRAAVGDSTGQDMIRERRGGAIGLLKPHRCSRRAKSIRPNRTDFARLHVLTSPLSPRQPPGATRTVHSSPR
jgi:hypothetical protein